MFKLFNRKNDTDKGLKIVYENKIVKSEVFSWVKKLGVRSFNDILIKLGFNENDVIYLYQDYGKLFSVLYSVNENKINNVNMIGFNYKKNEITISNSNGCKCYLFKELDDSSFLYDLELLYYNKKISDKISIFHRYGKDNSLFVVDNGDYELTLEIGLNTDNGCLLSEIEDINSRKLEEYLVNLEEPIVIENVYKDIDKILRLDESMFKIFDLVVTKNVDRKKTDIVLDEILICKGELERITKSYEYGTITLNKDGSWFYDKFDKDTVFSVKYNNNSRYRYSFVDNSSDKNRDFSELELYELKDDANIVVENTKKLVRKIFNM